MLWICERAKEKHYILYLLITSAFNCFATASVSVFVIETPTYKVKMTRRKQLLAIIWKFILPSDSLSHLFSVNVFTFCAIKSRLHSICEQGSKQRQHNRTHKDPDYTEQASEEGLRGLITVSDKVKLLNSAVHEVRPICLEEWTKRLRATLSRPYFILLVSHLNTLHNRYR